MKKALNIYASECSVIYLNSNEHPRAEIIVETRDARFEKWIKNKFPNKTYKKSADILYPLRAVKNDLEIELIKTACDITARGVKRVMSFLKPGVMEYEIEAEIVHEFLKVVLVVLLMIQLLHQVKIHAYFTTTTTIKFVCLEMLYC